MKTQITQNELNALFNKITVCVAGMCVAVNAGKVLRHRADTDMVRKVMALNPEIVCGFYNHGLKMEWLIEDLQYMGVEIAE